MADKNNIADDEYLDNLFKALTGTDIDTTSENSDNNATNDDNLGISDELDLSGIDITPDTGIENNFDLGEGLGIADNLDLGEGSGITDNLDLGKGLGIDDNLGIGENLGVEDNSDTEEKPNTESLISEDDLSIIEGMFDEKKDNDSGLDGISDSLLFDFNENAPGTENGTGTIISDDMYEGELIRDVDEGLNGELNINDMFQNAGQTANNNEASVETDLEGLFGILGVDSTTGEEQPQEEENEKRGLFGRKKKEKKPKKEKEKKPKKEKKSKKEKGNADNAPADDMLNGLAMEAVPVGDPALEGFDVEALFNSSDGFDMSGDFDFGGAETITFGSDENGGLTFGLDDSGFGNSGFDNSAENNMLFQQMDAEQLNKQMLSEEDDDDEKDKKGKKEKKAKEKKAKSDKKAKPKKTKKKKEPKVKAPKMPDEVVHISAIGVVFMLSFIVVAVVAAVLGGDYYFYQERMYDAVELYVDTEQIDIDAYESRYSEAYNLLSGMEMRNKEHQAFYDQVQTIMFMDRHYEAYKGYMLLENFDNGLDSLIKAVKMYDKYQNKARELGCFDDMTVVLSWVSNKLNTVYGITESRAREIYMISNDIEYAVTVREIAGKAKEKYLESKTEEELE